MDVHDALVQSCILVLFPWCVDAPTIMKNAILPRVLASVVHHLSKPSSFYHENNKENQKSFVEACPDHFVLLHSTIYKIINIYLTLITGKLLEFLLR